MVSNKNISDSGKRIYTLKARARRREEVHRRITEAAVFFHGTVGPARTTMGDIAKRAGVRRATVYNHFPTDLDLIDACSSHWFGENPPPDPVQWTRISDPGRRAEVAMGEMYEYYDRGQKMLENVLRDIHLVPAVKEILRLKWWPMLDGMVEMLAVGWIRPEGGGDVSNTEQQTSQETQPNPRNDNSELRASIRVSLDFFTWQTLTASGLSNDGAAKLAAAWIEAGRTVLP